MAAVAADPTLVAATAPSNSTVKPIVTPAAAAASPLTRLLSPYVTSFLPVAKAQSVIDLVDVTLAAHPWLAPAAYVALTLFLQNGIGTAHTLSDGSFVPGAAPHHIKMVALVIFTGAMLGVKALHTGSLQFVPDGIKFLLGGDASGLSAMLPAVSRFFYLQHLSYPLVAAAVIMLLPNSTPTKSALISAAVMLAPIGYAVAKKLSASSASLPGTPSGTT